MKGRRSNEGGQVGNVFDLSGTEESQSATPPVRWLVHCLGPAPTAGHPFVPTQDGISRWRRCPKYIASTLSGTAYVLSD